MTLRTPSRDTPPDAERDQFERLRRLTPAQRLRIAGRLSVSLERLVIAELRTRFPNAGAAELRKRAAARRLGPELAARYLGDGPWLE